MTDFTGKVINIDEQAVRDHLGDLVRGTVEETLNTMLHSEICVQRLPLP